MALSGPYSRGPDRRERENWTPETRALYATLRDQLDTAHATALDLLLERAVKAAQLATFFAGLAHVNAVLAHLPACLANRVREVERHAILEHRGGPGGGCSWRARAA